MRWNYLRVTKGFPLTSYDLTWLDLVPWRCSCRGTQQQRGYGSSPGVSVLGKMNPSCTVRPMSAQLLLTTSSHLFFGRPNIIYVRHFRLCASALFTTGIDLQEVSGGCRRLCAVLSDLVRCNTMWSDAVRCGLM